MKFSIYRKGSKDEIITIEYENGQNKWLLAITAAIESEANLTGADLTGADLTGADLTEANLTGADLYGANLSWANLSWADLTKANLAGADLSWANLTGADLTKANLAGADLDYCGFTFACKTFDIKADLRLAAQLAYHFCRLDFQDCEEAKQAQATLKELANKFHRVDECGEIGGAGEGC